MADALEAGRQGMKEKTPLKLAGADGHGIQFFPVLAPIVLPLKRYLAVFEREQPMVGDGHPMRVAAQVLQRSLRTAKGRFGVDYPVAVRVRAQQSLEGEGIVKRLDGTGESELVSIEGVFQLFEEEAAKQLGKHAHGKEEAGQEIQRS